jgi:hypothetical protein
VLTQADTSKNLWRYLEREMAVIVATQVSARSIEKQTAAANHGST